LKCSDGLTLGGEPEQVVRELSDFYLNLRGLEIPDLEHFDAWGFSNRDL